MLQFILWYSYYIICAVSRFSFIYMLKIFQEDVKLQTNQYVNRRLLFTDPNECIYLLTLLSFYLALITKKYEKRICFKKVLLVASELASSVDPV